MNPLLRRFLSANDDDDDPAPAALACRRINPTLRHRAPIVDHNRLPPTSARRHTMSAADMIAPWAPAPVLPAVHTVDSDDEIEFVGLRTC
jgi:hypothetical protein